MVGVGVMRKLLCWRIPLLLLGLFVGTIYLLTIAPGLTWAHRGADGGDLITAAATGGVPHPTGYPTYLLIARFFQYLPFGSLAFRTNLMSTVFALLTVLLVADVVRHSYAGPTWIGRIAGLLAGLGFGLSPLLWSQALITEVYTLHIFFVVLILWLFSLSGEGPFNNFWRDRFIGLIFGLSLGNHLTTVFLFPVLLGRTLMETDEKRGISPTLINQWDWSAVARRFGWLFMGLSVFLIIPIRAHSASPVNWGYPVDWDGFWWLVSGSMYQERIFHLGWQDVFSRLRTWAGMLQSQFGVPGLAIGLYGVFYGKTNGQRFYSITVWLMVVYSVFAIGYDSSDSYIFLLPTFLVFALWFGLGSASILAQIATTRWRAWLMPVAIGLTITNSIAHAGLNYDSIDASDSRRAETFAETVLTVAPEGAILFTHQDKDTFTLWYYHYALGVRPDLVLIAQPTLSYQWYRTTLGAVYPQLILPAMDSVRIPETIGALNHRPVCQVHLKTDDFLSLTNINGKEGDAVLECSP